jgi:nucleotide-binding universal stress UspA family protein
VHLRLWDQARGARFYLEEESEALELVDKASRWLAAFDIAAVGSVLSALRWLCAETVIRYAEVLHVGVVVVGYRKRTMASRALLGSTTYQIEKMSSLRVMVVHPA